MLTKQPFIQADKQYDINYIDASRLTTFCRCPAKLFFERLLGLQFGHGEDDKKRNTQRGRDTIKHFASMRNITGGNCNCPYKPLSFPDIVAPDAERVSENEIPFITDIGGPLAACGRIDLPVEWQGSKWPLDYKTCSEMGSRFFACFETSAQTAIYTVAMMNLTSDNNVKGMIIEGVRVSTKNDEVGMMPVFVDRFWLEQFIEYTNSKVEQMLVCNEKKEWPQNFSSCNPYGMFGQPGYTCQYLPLCRNKNWQNLISTFRQEEPWHPLKGIS
jgi:hypothetical protein